MEKVTKKGLQKLLALLALVIVVIMVISPTGTVSRFGDTLIIAMGVILLILTVIIIFMNAKRADAYVGKRVRKN